MSIVSATRILCAIENSVGIKRILLEELGTYVLGSESRGCRREEVSG